MTGHHYRVSAQNKINNITETQLSQQPWYYGIRSPYFHGSFKQRRDHFWTLTHIFILSSKCSELQTTGRGKNGECVSIHVAPARPVILIRGEREWVWEGKKKKKHQEELRFTPTPEKVSTKRWQFPHWWSCHTEQLCHQIATHSLLSDREKWDHEMCLPFPVIMWDGSQAPVGKSLTVLPRHGVWVKDTHSNKTAILLFNKVVML